MKIEPKIKNHGKSRQKLIKINKIEVFERLRHSTPARKNIFSIFSNFFPIISGPFSGHFPTIFQTYSEQINLIFSWKLSQKLKKHWKSRQKLIKINKIEVFERLRHSIPARKNIFSIFSNIFQTIFRTFSKYFLDIFRTFPEQIKATFLDEIPGIFFNPGGVYILYSSRLLTKLSAGPRRNQEKIVQSRRALSQISNARGCAEDGDSP